MTEKHYDMLTPRGKGRRLRQLALNALTHYSASIRELRFMGLHTNALFRVRSRRGARFVLRICKPGWRTETDLASEVAWLAALAEETDIGAPAPVPARNGAYLVTAAAPGVPEPRHCLLFTWLPGKPLAAQLTEPNLHAMGILFAALHDHAASFTPPPGFTRRRMSNILARGEPNSLAPLLHGGALNKRAKDALNQVHSLVKDAFDRRYADATGLRVIHNDLWHGNILIHQDRLRPLDFEDTIWGYPVQDIAMALQDLMVDVPTDAFEPLQAALRQGYETRASWPERTPTEIDLFRAGRMLWVANYVASHQPQHLHDHISRLTPMLERFLTTGKLRKQV